MTIGDSFEIPSVKDVSLTLNMTIANPLRKGGGEEQCPAQPVIARACPKQSTAFGYPTRLIAALIAFARNDKENCPP